MKIAVRMPNWLGDMVMSTAFLNALNSVYPDAEIHLIVKDGLKDLTKFFIRDYTIHPFPKKEFKGLYGAFKFGRKLRNIHFDIFFSLPDSLSSAVMIYSSGAKQRIGYRKEGRSWLLTTSFNKADQFHRVDEYVTLLERFTGITIPHKKVILKTTFNRNLDNFVAVNFNSEAGSRRMPLEKGRKILKSLIDNFPDQKFLLVGSPSEFNFVEQLIQEFPERHLLENFAGKTDLSGLCNLLSSSKLLISTDSGPAHLANAIGIPVLVLFGAGDESRTAPYNLQSLKIMRAGKLPCEPCIKNKCSLYGVPECMNLLEEEQINQYVKLYLNNA